MKSRDKRRQADAAKLYKRERETYHDQPVQHQRLELCKDFDAGSRSIKRCYHCRQPSRYTVTIAEGGFIDMPLCSRHFDHFRGHVTAEKWNAQQEQYGQEAIEMKGSNKETWFERLAKSISSAPDEITLASPEERARLVAELTAPYERRREAAKAKLHSSKLAKLKKLQLECDRRRGFVDNPRDVKTRKAKELETQKRFLEDGLNGRLELVEANSGLAATLRNHADGLVDLRDDLQARASKIQEMALLVDGDIGRARYEAGRLDEEARVENERARSFAIAIESSDEGTLAEWWTPPENAWKIPRYEPSMPSPSQRLDYLMSNDPTVLVLADRDEYFAERRAVIEAEQRFLAEEKRRFDERARKEEMAHLLGVNFDAIEELEAAERQEGAA